MNAESSEILKQEGFTEPGPLATDKSPFGRWLRKCVGRQDPVGALADVAARDPNWPGGHDLDALRVYFVQMGARDFVRAALERAIAEFERAVQADKAESQRRTKAKAARAARRRNRR